MTTKSQSGKIYDIAIAGAGAAGLALACLLAGAGFSVALIDPAPPPHARQAKAAPSGRTVALMNSGLNILKAAGLQAPEKYGTALRVMRILDESLPGSGRLEARFDSADMGLTQYGFNIPNDALIEALYERASSCGELTILPGESYDRMTAGAAHCDIMLKSGAVLQARVLAGADGRNSAVRESCGIGVKKHDYGQSAITCLISHARPHENVSTEFHRPAGPLAFVPMPGHISSIVWVERTARAGEILRLRKEEFIAALEKAAGDILGPLQLESPPSCWPLCAMTAERLTAPRTALIAEAAHVMSPITAQGLNLSLRDVAALAEVLTDAARAGVDIGSPAVLKTYESRRKLDTAIRTQGVDTMMRLVSTEHGLVKALRRAGLRAVAGIPPLKGFAMEHGLAPEADKGRLAKGLPL